MRERIEEIEQTGYRIVVIAPSTGPFLEKFTEAFGPYPFPIYGDPERALYRKMGHVTMQKWKLLGKAAAAYIKHGSKGFLPEHREQQAVVKEAMKTHDIYMQGGTIIVNAAGDVIWRHVDASPEDHASIDKVLAVLRDEK